MVLVRLLGPFLDNVRLEHGGLPHVLPHTVHLIFFCGGPSHKTAQSPNFPFGILVLHFGVGLKLVNLDY